MRAICYISHDNRRAEHVASAMSDGFRRHGIDVSVRDRLDGVVGDIAVAYGWRNKHTFEAYRKNGGHYLYFDLGFWQRKPKTRRYEGYYKSSLDGWCPVKTMRRGCPSDRFDYMRVDVKPYRPGQTVLVAGMSGKSAYDHGYTPEQWERNKISELRSTTKREIVYRPKPSWMDAKVLPGASFDRGDGVEGSLARAHVLVTHHSNAAIDAAVEGVAVYCELGIGTLFSTAELSNLDAIRYPNDSDRLSALYDTAYTQWSPAEMRSGECWANYMELMK